MFPYPAISNSGTTAPAGKPPTDSVTFIEVNENLEAGAIFDSRSGVTILDSGVDETNFERSLWGTLGFQYSQFNTSGSNILNSNTRFTEDITNVSGLTTNANIISTTAVNYPQNSDILDQTGWYHQANAMSVLASVGKYSAENDFVEYGGGGAEFTVTRKKTITAITTQILDPVGQLAQVGDNSGIIYRIDKQINTDLNFAENVMNGVYKK